MPRPARFNEDQMLDAALDLVASGGPGTATIAAIASAVRAPVGSIYHRFGSRDLLLARLWIRTIKRFQLAFLKALGPQGDAEAAERAVRSTIGWVRGHPKEAAALLLYRRQDLASEWPNELGEELAHLNGEVEAAVRRVALGCFGDDGPEAVARATFALVDIPYAGVRRYLAAGEPPPRHMDDVVALASRRVLEGNRGKRAAWS